MKTCYAHGFLTSAQLISLRTRSSGSWCGMVICPLKRVPILSRSFSLPRSLPCARAPIWPDHIRGTAKHQSNQGQLDSILQVERRNSASVRVVPIIGQSHCHPLDRSIYIAAQTMVSDPVLRRFPDMRGALAGPP